MGSTRPSRKVRWLALSAGIASIAAPALSASAGIAVAKGTTWTAGQTSSRLGGATLKDVIVQATAGSEGAVAAAVVAAGGTIDEALPIINGFSAHVPADAVDALRARADVVEVSENREVHFSEFSYDDSEVASNFVRSTGASAAWDSGNHGEGVGVAVIDTGISSMNDFKGRLVHGPDLSGEGRAVDTYGHGTVMAGLIGGDGHDSASRSSGAFTGVAPESTLVSVKAAGANGAADVSTMLQAMHWVAAYKDQFNIRVLNLSWGTNATSNPAADPLNYAVQRLWKAGIVVVVAAGNSGNAQGTITKPGDDPNVITVGAYNDNGDSDVSNDVVPAWSSRGPTSTGLVKPDIVAPGRTLVSSRSFGSTIERENPRALVSPSYIKGSGTSQAAAVVSGLAALLVKAHPDWTPDQVKAALRNTADPISGYGQYAQGKGRVDFDEALTTNPGAAVQQSPAGTGLGSIQASRGGMSLYADCNQDGTYEVIQGEIDVWCNPWNGASWTGASWTGASWTGASWTGASWTGASWTGASWTGASWTGASWTTAEYDDDEDQFLTAWWGRAPKYGQSVKGEKSEARQAARAAGLD